MEEPDQDLAQEGFYGRISLPDHLTKVVSEAMEERKIPNKDLAEKVYKQLGVGVPETARGLVLTILAGKAYRLVPSPFRKNIAKRSRTQLYRISVLLHALDIEADNPLIQRFNRNYNYFIYPPKYESL